MNSGPSVDSRSNRAARVVAALFSFILIATSAKSDPTTAGIPVAPAHNSSEYGPAAIPDGLGGAFVGFKAGKTGTSELFAAQVDAAGTPNPSWHPVGVPVATDLPRRTVFATNQPGRVWLIADRMPFLTYFARKVGPDGLTQPDTTLDSGGALVEQASAFPLPADRVLVAVAVPSPSPRLWYSIFEADGSLTYFPTIALPYAWPSDSRRALAIAPDGGGGAWILGNTRSSPSPGTEDDFIAVRIASDGSPVLSPAYRVVCNAARKQLDGAIAADGAGGIYAAWTDRRDLLKSDDLFAQHLLADGSIAPGWLTQGRAIASYTGDQFQPSIAPDGSGGVWLAWIDSRSGVNDIYYTRIGPDGAPAPGFPVGGRPLCSAIGSQIGIEIIPDGSGGFYASWLDARDGELDLYAQHIHSTGAVMPGWNSDGLPLCTEASEQGSNGLLMLSAGHVLATWNDSREGYLKAYTTILPVDGEIVGVRPLSGVALDLRSARDPARSSIEMVLTSGSAGPVRVSLHDLAGRVLEEQSVEGSPQATRVRFDTDRLGPGLYFARARRGTTTVTARVSLVR